MRNNRRNPADKSNISASRSSLTVLDPFPSIHITYTIVRLIILHIPSFAYILLYFYNLHLSCHKQVYIVFIGLNLPFIYFTSVIIIRIFLLVPSII